MDDNYFEVEESTPLLPAEQQTDDMPPIEVQPEGAPPPSPRKRLLQMGLVVVALVVALAVIGRPLLNGPAPGVSSATPQPTAAPQTILLNSNISFGTVTINDKPQRGALPMFLRAREAEGGATYNITVNAPPFRPVSCSITIFAGQATSGYNSPCNVVSGSFPTMTANGITATPDYLIHIDFTGDDLPADQLSQVNALLTQSFIDQQSTTAPTGTYFATSLNANNTITSQRATVPLHVTVFAAPSTNLGQWGFPCTDLICQTGVDLLQYPGTITGKVWMIGVPLALRWQTTTAAGRVLGDVSFPVAGTAPTLLSYTPGAGWSLSPEWTAGQFGGSYNFGNLDCNTGMQVLQQQYQAGGFGYSSDESQGMEGCKISVQDNAGTIRGVYIWRFGVLLAADKAAHDLLPNLPMAPQAEIDAVQGHLQGSFIHQ